MIILYRILPFILLLMSVGVFAEDIQRFPPPDFESGYTFPEITTPTPRADIMGFVDIAVLVAALCVGTYLVYKNRERKWVFLLAGFSLFYFGFIRYGCICSIGAIQNVSLALSDGNYTIPIVATAFFVIPLVFTLFVGRIFCAGVCPLGAIQDLVLIKPIQLPHWLIHGLSMFAYLYLGAAVLFATMGSAFIICEYDPFVSFFRLSGNLNIVILGSSLLVIALFVGRPYCLFLCPYSVILRTFSRFSQWRVSISPEECRKCQLCEEACPFGAILPPTPEDMPNPNAKDRKRLTLLLIMIPVFIAMGGWALSWAGPTFAKMDFTVRLAEQIAWEDQTQQESLTDASKAFRDSGQSKNVLFTEAQTLRDQYTFGTWILGGFLGLVIALKLIEFSIFEKREDYDIDNAECVACARCFSHCPVEIKRQRALKTTN